MKSSNYDVMAVVAFAATFGACLRGAEGRPLLPAEPQPQPRVRVFDSADASCDVAPALFVFGASYLDVGENYAAMPFRSQSDFAPYGIDFLGGRATGRYSNGRLIIDHIAHGLGQEHLSPYLRDSGTTFRHGVSFASSGSTACNTSVRGDGSDSSGLFSFSIQVDQFQVFLQQTLAAYTLEKGRSKHLPTLEAFSRGVYIIEFGGNDYVNVSSDQFEAKTQLILESMEHALRALYKLGARTFVVMDAYPVGCYPCLLWKSTPEDLDENGCIVKSVKAMEQHNHGLRAMVAQLNAELKGANLVIFSLHEIFMSAIRNPSKFGLKYVHKACCGYGGGLYNNNGNLPCGREGVVDGVLCKTTVCENRSEYMMWDFVHPTDAFAFHIAQAFLNGEHMHPPFYIKEMCRHKEGEEDE